MHTAAECIDTKHTVTRKKRPPKQNAVTCTVYNKSWTLLYNFFCCVYISLYNFVLCNLAVYFILLLKNKLDLTLTQSNETYTA